MNTLAFWYVAGQEKRLNKFALAAHDHSWEPLVPWADRNLWRCVEPFREKLQLRGWNVPFLNSFQKVLKQGRGDIVAADLRHGEWSGI